MKKSTQKIVTTIFVMVLVALGVVLVYYSMTKKAPEENTNTKKSELEKILSKDLETNYPATPKEVMKFYGRITACFYKDKLSEQDVEALAEKLRCLFDDELLAKNPKEQYMKAIKKDVQEFRDIDKKIMSYSVENASAIEEVETNGKTYATCTILFLTQEKQKKKSYSKVFEEFILRQDESGKWKILGWQQTEPKEMPE